METTCIGIGMFSMGNMNPLSMTVGKNMPINDINMADCWDAVEDEMSKPRESATSINNMLSPTSTGRLQLMGTSSTKTLNKSMLTMFTIDKSK